MDSPHVLTCSPDKWFDSCTPQIWGQDAVSIDKLAAELRKQKPKVLSNDGWVCLLNAQGDEDTMFSNISSIALAVRSAVEKLYSIKPTAVMQTLPRQGTLSEVQGYRYLPGARATLLDFDRPVPPPSVRRSPFLDKSSVPSENTSETVWLAEFKLKSTDWDREDNEAQIMSAATDVMYNDPCRRFMTGFTIEKDQMRLWYFCRGHILVSDFFNLHEEPNLIIRFLVYVQFAHTSDLGYDPTVSCRWVNVEGKPDQQIAYEYRIEGRNFLTKGNPLSESAAFELVSRATRVWEVIEILPGGSFSAESYVLRDAWLYEDAQLEGKIHADILKELANLDNDMRNAGGEPTHHESEAQRHLLTFICEGWVTTTDDSEEHDITAALPGLPTATPFTRPKVAAKSLTPGSQRGSRHDLRRVDTQSKPPSLKHHRLKHARTVSRETCESVYEIKDFRSLVSCLSDIVKALNLMRLAGYVHRDVSAGNCLWLPPTDTEPGRGILSDLEFSKPYAQMSGHDPRTGTPAFMAMEYQARQYFFLPNPDNIFSAKPVEFIFNFYHDLESVFWIFVYFIHFRPPITLQDKPEELVETVRQSAIQYLSDNIQGNSSRYALVALGTYHLCSQLAPLYGDESWLLSGVQVVHTLRSAYRVLENMPMSDGRWNEDCFTSQPYSDIMKRLSKLMPEHVDVPVMNIRYMGTKPQEDEELGKDRIEQATEDDEMAQDQAEEPPVLGTKRKAEAGEDQAERLTADEKRNREN
ncbi:hypothetical protein FA95DRAFT_1674534 [Auriscalpium vulgare]|uniref:Uncharacterized protein n=1 Tax=Auriscalpium vulgare TaxID=40419 RepID=A0ACB8SB40_9AGAM|nr:hypothetical protein FA95DRAFT_1674534 [Auriscalpium vulgare]